MVLSAAKSAAVGIETLKGGGLRRGDEAPKTSGGAADPALVRTGGGQGATHLPGIPDHTQPISLVNGHLPGEDRVVESIDGYAAAAEVLAYDGLGTMKVAQQQIFTGPRLCEVPEVDKLLSSHSENGAPSTIHATGVAYDEVPGAPGRSATGKVTTAIER